jgi:hypothetical protein
VGAGVLVWVLSGAPAVAGVQAGKGEAMTCERCEGAVVGFVVGLWVGRWVAVAFMCGNCAERWLWEMPKGRRRAV